MSQQKPKVAQKQSVEEIKKELGIERLYAFRRADLTPELREKTGLAPEDEFRLVAVAELHDLGLPLELAEAVGLSGALGSASDLPGLKAEEVERILNEPPVKRLLPTQFEFNLERIEEWLQRARPLTADEDAPARDAVAEDQEESAASDDEAAVAREDVLLSRESVDELLNVFRERWRRGKAAVKALARGKDEQANASAVRHTLLDLQAGISDVLDRFMAGETGGFEAIDEDRAPAFADEGLDPRKDVQLLEAELKRIELTLQDLRVTVESGDESRSPAVAIEERDEDVETPLRGE